MSTPVLTVPTRPPPRLLQAPGQASCALGLTNGARHLLYSTLSVLTVGPVVWVLLLSFRTTREIAQHPFALPTHYNLDNYRAVFERPEIGLFLINSLIVVGAALALVLVASTLAAYAIARIDFPGRHALFVLFLISDSIPLIVIIVPLFIVVQHLGLSQSLFAMILPYAAMNMGVSVYILRGFFRSINSDIEDAARLDHCGLLATIWYIILPLARPSLLVVGIMNFISYWNEYFLATVLASSQHYFTLPAGLAATLVNKHGTDWPLMSAAVIMTTVPIVLLFVLMQDRIVRGWASSVR
jgi:ABC-type glycerol-3-phosphate transport system permease component